MNTFRNILSKPLFVGMLSFLVGLFIGLVVLGWGLMPVQWESGTLQHVDPDIQEDFLRMAIDSYALNQDAALARARYQSLGMGNEALLASIYAEPGTQYPAAIEAYALAVGAETALTAEVPPSTGPQESTNPFGLLISRPLWAGVCVLTLLLAACVVALIVLGSQERRREAGTSPTLPQAVSLKAIAINEEPASSQTWEPEDTAKDIPIQPKVLDEATSESIVTEEPAMVPFWETPGEETPSLTQAESLDELITLEEPPLGQVEEEDVAPPDEIGEVAKGTAMVEFAESLGDETQEAESLDEVMTFEEPTLSQIDTTDEPILEDISDADQVIAPGEFAEIPADGILQVETLDEAVIFEEPPLSQVEATDEPRTDEVGEVAKGMAMDEIIEAQGEEVYQAEPSVGESHVEIEAETSPPEEPAQSEEDLYAKFPSNLKHIEGIGEAYAAKLKEVGISAPVILLRAGATPKGRKAIAEKTGISGKLILKWINQVDLYRIKGVGQEYADLLEAAGVDTVLELARRNPLNLHQTLTEINEEKRLVRQTPGLSQVEDWIEQAKQLPRAITY